MNIKPYQRWQPLKWLTSGSGLQSSITYTPLRDFMASRMLLNLDWTLTGASKTSMDAIHDVAAAATPIALTTPAGIGMMTNMLLNPSFQSLITNNIIFNFSLLSRFPSKSQVRATDVMLRDLAYCGVPPHIEYNKTTGLLNMSVWIHFERPFANESAMVFSVNNQNTIQVSLPTLSASNANYRLFYTTGAVEQKYLFYEGYASKVVPAPNGDFAIDERNIADVFMYDNANISETGFIKTLLNGNEVSNHYLTQLRYNSLLSQGDGMFSGSSITANRAFQVYCPLLRVFENPVLNVPSHAIANKNFSIEVPLTAQTTLQFFYTKIVETDRARLETETVVQRLQASYAS